MKYMMDGLLSGCLHSLSHPHALTFVVTFVFVCPVTIGRSSLYLTFNLEFRSFSPGSNACRYFTLKLCLLCDVSCPRSLVGNTAVLVSVLNRNAHFALQPAKGREGLTISNTMSTINVVHQSHSLLHLVSFAHIEERT